MNYYYLLVGRYEEKQPVDVKDRLSARPAKIGQEEKSEIQKLREQFEENWGTFTNDAV